MFLEEPEKTNSISEYEPKRLSLPDAPILRGYNTNPQEAAAELIRKLSLHRQLSYIAGGWVRDRFLVRPAYDVDICSSASIEMLTKILGASKVLPLHANTARVTYGREKFEVTRFKGFRKRATEKCAFLDASESDPTPDDMGSIDSLVRSPSASH